MASVFGQTVDPLGSACILGLGIASCVPHVGGVTFSEAGSANPSGPFRYAVLKIVLLHMQQVVLRIVGCNCLHLFGTHHGSIGQGCTALGWAVFERFVVNGLQMLFSSRINLWNLL